MASMAQAKKKTNNLLSTLHPPYIKMISEALATLKERNGSSQPAIAKVLEEKYQKRLPPNFKKMLSVQLRKFVQSKKLVKVKNSYKMSAYHKAAKGTEKKKTVGKVKKTNARSGGGPKRAMNKKPKMAKKPVGSGDKMTVKAAMKKKRASTPMPRKAAPKTKRPKSMKSSTPVPKRAKKVKNNLRY